MSNVVQKEIPPQKKYEFPRVISEINYKDKFLIVAVETANWIILENQNQLDFFHLLKNHTIEESLSIYKGEYSDAVQTVIQLEAKQFENKYVNRVSTDSLFIYLTHACNLRCPHCYVFADVKQKEELSTSEITNVLSYFKKNGGKSVTFSGGEVCVRADFAEIIESAKNTGLKVEVLSNGTLWTKELIERLSSSIDKIQISVDGFSEEENAKQRGNGNFEKALNTVEKFVNLGVETTIAMTPFLDSSLSEKVENYILFAKNLKDKYASKKFKIIFTNDLLDGRDVAFSKDEKKLYSELMKKIYIGVYGDDSDSGFIENHKQHKILDNCSFGNLYIAPNGDVFACARIYEMKPFANVRKDGFKRVLSLSKLVHDYSCIENLKPCNACDLKYICGGGCRMNFFKELAQIENPETFDVSNICVRKCSKAGKEKFYDLMIRVNKDLFE